MTLKNRIKDLFDYYNIITYFQSTNQCKSNDQIIKFRFEKSCFKKILFLINLNPKILNSNQSNSFINSPKGN